MSSSFDFDQVDQFLCGAVGPPGNRTFYLQSVRAGTVVSFKIEKQQVSMLADYLERVLATHELDEGAPAHMAELIEPVLAEWTIGSMMVALNEATGRVIVIAEEMPVIELESLGEIDPDEIEIDLNIEVEVAEVRIGLTRGQVEAFIDGARRIIDGGRPLCRLCGRPMDADGHACPRWN